MTVQLSSFLYTTIETSLQISKAIMPTGSCLCGEIKISYTGDPTYTAICYCDDERKMSNVQTYQVPKQNFTLVAGEPKVYTKVSDFDRVRHFHFSLSHTFCVSLLTPLPENQLPLLPNLRHDSLPHRRLAERGGHGRRPRWCPG